MRFLLKHEKKYEIWDTLKKHEADPKKPRVFAGIWESGNTEIHKWLPKQPNTKNQNASYTNDQKDRESARKLIDPGKLSNLA